MTKPVVCRVLQEARGKSGEDLAAVVDHEPFKGHLEVTLTHEADSLVATLRSDGWFVDEAVGKDVESLAATLAVSQRLTDFIRNSGLPQQHMVPEQ